MPLQPNKLISKAGYLLDDIFAFICAPRCPGCEAFLENPREQLCPNCDSKLSYTGDGPVCLLCRSPEAVGCACSNEFDFHLPQLYFWTKYTDVIRALIHRFKFEKQMELGVYLTVKALGQLHQRMLSASFDIIIPIPMTASDKRKRTFNQTEIMARTLAKQFGRPYDTTILRKIKPTRLQANLGQQERWQNIKGAFAVDKPEEVAGKAILLIDDIVTTGATSLEASKALFAVGGKSVTVFAIASSH